MRRSEDPGGLTRLTIAVRANRYKVAGDVAMNRTPILTIRTARSVVAVLLAALTLVVGATAASADQVDTLIKRMRTSSDYKVRLSAALNLSKLYDQRSIPAFIEALGDSDKTVRGVAAASLGKIVSPKTEAALRKRATAALQKLAKSDKDAFVRKQASKAYARVSKIQGAPTGGSSKVYINIGAMADKAGDRRMIAMMRKTAEKTFTKNAPAMATDWPGGKAPSARDLKKARAAGFYVDGTLTELSVEGRGSSSIVSCKVSMLVATFPDKSMFGFLKGGASVQSGSSDRDVSYAKEDCVVAVVEDLVKRKIIPTIKSRAP